MGWGGSARCGAAGAGSDRTHAEPGDARTGRGGSRTLRWGSRGPKFPGRSVKVGETPRPSAAPTTSSVFSGSVSAGRGASLPVARDFQILAASVEDRPRPLRRSLAGRSLGVSTSRSGRHGPGSRESAGVRRQEDQATRPRTRSKYLGPDTEEKPECHWRRRPFACPAARRGPRSRVFSWVPPPGLRASSTRSAPRLRTDPRREHFCGPPPDPSSSPRVADGRARGPQRRARDRPLDDGPG